MTLEDFVSSDSDALANADDHFRQTNLEDVVQRRQSPSPTKPRPVSGRGVVMPSLNKRQKKNTDGPCFNENVRLRFIYNLNRKSPTCRVLTIEKYNSIVSQLMIVCDDPCSAGLRVWQLTNYRRTAARVYYFYYLEEGKLVLRTKEGPRVCGAGEFKQRVVS